MTNPTMEDRLEWTIADNVKKAIEIADLRETAKTGVRCMEQRNEALEEVERLNKLVDDIAYTAKNRKKKMRKYRDALIAIQHLEPGTIAPDGSDMSACIAEKALGEKK